MNSSPADAPAPQSDTHSTKTTVELTRRRAAFRLRQLLGELHMLMGVFPDLRDAFDADDLPLAFILKRDSRLMEPDAGPRRPSSARAKTPVNRRASSAGTRNRNGHRKQISDK